MKAFLKELLLSFYARTFYSALAREKSGIGARFMLALSVALLLPAGLVLFPAARGMVSAAEVVAAQMPKMDFSGGRLAIDAPSPRVIPLGALGGKMAIAVDTNSSISDMTADEKRMREEHLLMLFGADGAVFRGRSAAGFRVYNYGDMKKPAIITHDDWRKFGAKAARFGLPALLLAFTVCGLAGAFLYNLVATFAGAIAVFVAGALLRTGVAFDGAMRLAAAARFPAGLIGGVAGLFVKASWTGWAVLLGYLFFAAFSPRRAAKETA